MPYGLRDEGLLTVYERVELSYPARRAGVIAVIRIDYEKYPAQQSKLGLPRCPGSAASTLRDLSTLNTGMFRDREDVTSLLSRGGVHKPQYPARDTKR